MSQGALKVAFDNSLAGRNLTGTGVYASQLIRGLSARQDIQLTVLSGWGPRNDRGAFQRKIRGLARLAWSHAYLPVMLRKDGFDVLHAPAFVIPPGCPSPTVVTIHDLSFFTHPQHFGWPWRTYVTSLMPSVLRSASGIICVSESTKRDLLRYYKVADDKVHVVYNGLDHTRFHAGAKLDCKWARSVGVRTPYVLHVGAFSERKNIPVLLRSVAKLRNSGKFNDFQLVLAGKEAPGLVGARTIDEIIKEFQLEDTVLKVGHVSDDKLAGLYAAAQVLVMPSSYEGFGFPVLEAMAVGTAVIASNTSSLPEIAGDAALLVSPEDEEGLAEAISLVHSDGSLRQTLRAKGLDQAKKFTWEKAAEQTAAVYRAVVRP